MKKFAIVAASALLLSGCMKASETTNTVGSGGVKVETLFTHEGCRVYRFYDGRYVYFSNCQGHTQWSEQCGKGCVRDEYVPTTRYQEIPQ